MNVSQSSASVLGRVQELMRDRFGLAQEQVCADRELASLGIDSLAALDFVFDLEDAFGVSLSADNGQLRTVADVATLVETALLAGSAPA
jgi:acyl carrier protein